MATFSYAYIMHNICYLISMLTFLANKRIIGVKRHGNTYCVLQLILWFSSINITQVLSLHNHFT